MKAYVDTILEAMEAERKAQEMIFNEGLRILKLRGGSSSASAISSPDAEDATALFIQ